MAYLNSDIVFAVLNHRALFIYVICCTHWTRIDSEADFFITLFFLHRNKYKLNIKNPEHVSINRSIS